MSPKNTHILIAPRFDELAVVHFVAHMRHKGMSVKLVSLTPGLSSSMHGLKIHPDLSLSELRQNDVYNQLLVIPGDPACASAILADPRTHQLIIQVLNNNGLIAALLPAQQLLAKIGLPSNYDSWRFLAQNDMEITDFINLLIEYVNNKGV